MKQIILSLQANNFQTIPKWN